MAVQVQFRRGTKAQHDAFTGATGEVTVNTTDKTLVMHDGTTQGGFNLARADGENLDLSGLAGVTTVTSVAIHGGTVNNTTIGIGTSANANFTNLNVVDGQVGSALSVGAATTHKELLVVNGDARITGILTVGTGTIVLDGTNNTISGVDGGTFAEGTFTTLNATTLRAVTGVVTTLTSTDANITADARVGAALTVTGDATFQGNVYLGDNDKINLGDGNDLQIYHNGSNSYVRDTGTGDLVLAGSNNVTILNADLNQTLATFSVGGSVDLYHNNSKKFETTAYGVDVTGTTGTDNLAVSGVSTFTGTATFQGNVYLGDNDKLVLGDSGDLEIFHDGSNSIIDDVGTGSLVLRSDTSIALKKRTGDENQLVTNPDGSVDLYYDASKKFETTAYGVDVTGTTGTDGLIVSGVTTTTGTLDANGNVTVAGTLDVDGQGIFDDITVSAASTFVGNVIAEGNVTINGDLIVEGTQTIINVDQLDVQDKTIGVASTSTASNTTANGGGFFVHGGANGDKEILWQSDTASFEVNQSWLPSADNSYDLGASAQEWRNLYLDGTANIDSLVADTADINAGTIDNTTIGGSSASPGTFTNLTAQGNVQLGDSAADSITYYGRVVTDIVPSPSNTYDLGRSGNIWAQVWAGQVTAGNIQIDVTANEIDTSSGNLTIDSAGGTTTIDDILSVSGNATFSGTIDVDGQAIFDDITVSAASTFTGNVTMNANLDLQDNDKILLGTGDDLEIYHDGSNSRINNATGELIIRNDADNQDIALQSDNGSGGATTYVRCDGSSGQVQLSHYGSQKLNTTSTGINVTGSVTCDGLTVDGEPYITGTNPTISIQDTNSTGGSDSTSFIRGRDSAGTVTWYAGQGSSARDALILYATSGNIELSAAGSKRAEVTSAAFVPGADDTYDIGTSSLEWRNGYFDGTVNCDSLDVDGYVNFNGGNVDIIGANYNLAWNYTNSKLNFNDNAKATFGTGDDLQIYHDGTHSYIDDAATGTLHIRGSQINIDKYTGEASAKFKADGNVELYYDNSKKFETASGGVTITGTATATQFDATSDIKLKENVTTIENGLDKVSQLRGVEFDFKSDGKHSLGVIAQEVEEVLPDLVSEMEDGTKTVAYANLTAVLIEAVKELKAEVAELRSRLDG